MSLAVWKDAVASYEIVMRNSHDETGEKYFKVNVSLTEDVDSGNLECNNCSDQNYTCTNM